MSEKAISIGCYFVGSGVYTIFGSESPVRNSEVVDRFISQEWEERVGGKLEFIPDPDEAVQKALSHIDKKRAALGLVDYDPERFGQSGDATLLKVLEQRGEDVFNLYSAKVGEPSAS
jgi:carbon-monoxide dehydrogenase catalytic subunit